MRIKSKSDALFFLFNYGNVLIQFLALPLFISAVGTYGFGRYSYLVAISNWIAFIATLGTQTKLRKVEAKIISVGISKEVILEYRSHFTILYFLCVTSILLLIPIAWISDLSNVELSVLYIYYLSYALSSCISAIILGRGFFGLAAFSTFMYTGMPLVVFIILGYILPDIYWYFRLIISAALMVVFTLYAVFSLNIRKCLVPTRENLFNSFVGSFRISLNGLYDKIIGEGDKIFVGAFLGMNALAVYSLGVQITSALRTFVSFFFLKLEKMLFEERNNIILSVIKVSLVYWIAAILGILFFYYLYDFFFEYELFSVFDIIVLQVAIVFCRLLSGLLFIRSYMAGKEIKLVIVQYFYLLLSCIYMLIYMPGDLFEFCLVVFIMYAALLLTAVSIKGKYAVR